MPPDAKLPSTPTRCGMALVASTSAESKKTVGKCNITHRFGGPRRARKKTFLLRVSWILAVSGRDKARRLTLTRAYACGAVNLSDSLSLSLVRRTYTRYADGNVTVPRFIRGSCHGIAAVPVTEAVAAIALSFNPRHPKTASPTPREGNSAR